MGVFNGSLTVSRFHVDGELPRGHRRQFLERIRLRQFRPLEPDEEAEERMGWCAAGEVLDLEPPEERIFVNHYLLLGLRIDRWRIPGSLLRAHYERACREAREKTGKERLAKNEKDAIKARVVGRLRRRVLPSMKLVDLCWDTERGVLWFWSQSSKLHEHLAVLFEQTFGLELTEASPYVEALRAAPALEEWLAEVQPEPPHRGPERPVSSPDEEEATEEG